MRNQRIVRLNASLDLNYSSRALLSHRFQSWVWVCGNQQKKTKGKNDVTPELRSDAHGGVMSIFCQGWQMNIKFRPSQPTIDHQWFKV